MAEAAAFDPKVFKQAVDEKTNARLKMWLEICAHCGLCADTCHFYLASDRDPVGARFTRFSGKSCRECAGGEFEVSAGETQIYSAGRATR